MKNGLNRFSYLTPEDFSQDTEDFDPDQQEVQAEFKQGQEIEYDGPNTWLAFN